MNTTYDSSLKATVTVDDGGHIRGINHLDEYREMEGMRGREAATAYVREIAAKFNITPSALRNLEQVVSYLDPQEKDTEYRFSEEKTSFDMTTYGYYQTYLNTPVWAAGLTATVKQAPARVVTATNTSAYDINAKMPSAAAVERYQKLFATAEKAETKPAQRKVKKSESPDIMSFGLLPDILGRLSKTSKAVNDQAVGARLIRGRFFVYRYDPAKRTEDFPEQTPDTTIPERIGATANPLITDAAPSLALPPAPKSIRPGNWYLVAELIIRAPYLGRSMNWRLLVEIETNTILYIRPLTSGVSGLVFTSDPITATGVATNSPAATTATLDPIRSAVTLPGLTAPMAGSNQALTGNFVRISDFELATATPPTEAPGSNFNYNARTNNFAAVNAYYHCDRFFRLVEDLGFTISTYFNGTSFPIPIDHRGRYGSLDGIERNASCSGDGDGIANVDFELADLTDTTNPMGIAADWRVVLHELGGHGILYDHVNTANFLFAHSAGDSFAVILNDPQTQAADRFESFPWVSFISRRHDRAVSAGWGWGGTNDTGGYSSEQILATTNFRAYRSIGGDSTELGRRQFAARCMAYLLLRAVGTLTPMSNPNSPAQFLNALLTADNGNWTSEGLFGGAYGKVLRWAFEKQNLNSGNPPAIDVYIDDGRAGEYQYQAVHWQNQSMWNRNAADGLTAHQNAIDGQTNYMYGKVKNRGTSTANNVTVRAFHSRPGAGLTWPNDFVEMSPVGGLTISSIAANNAAEITVGPFEWEPNINTYGHDCVLMIASVAGDPSNIDNFTGTESIQEWRLVPHDNNIGQRNVSVVPGGGGATSLIAALDGAFFIAGNNLNERATMELRVEMPSVLADKGWQLRFEGLSENKFPLKAGEKRRIQLQLKKGAEFTKADMEKTTDRMINVSLLANGILLGGMSYYVDPELRSPSGGKVPIGQTCDTTAQNLLECLNISSHQKVKSVCVKKVSLDIELDNDCNCD